MQLKKMLCIVSSIVVFGVSSIFANALLVEDNLPWGFNSNSQTLSDIGITFSKISSSDIGSYNLADYDFVVLASDQGQSYYDNLKLNNSAIDNYVYNGGTLIAHECIWGWNNGVWQQGDLLPGSVGTSYLDRDQQYSNSVKVLDPSSQVISGPYGTITESDFQNWNYSTHGYFTNLLPGTKSIIGIDDASKPCYIEYAYGTGTVRASMMTVEWGNNDPNNTRYIFRENEFYAAQHPVNTPEPATLSMIFIGIMSFAGCAALRRKVK